MSEHHGTGGPSTGGGTGLGQILIVLVGAGVCVAAIAFEPSDGRSFIDAAAMLFSYIALIDVARRGYTGVQRSGGGTGGLWERMSDVARRRPRTTAAALAVLIAAVSFLTWYYTTASAKTVTGHVTATRIADDGTTSEPTGLTDCYIDDGREEARPTDECVPVSIGIPGDPPDRDHVRLVIDLHNEATAGSCVAPADIVLTPVVDGVARDGVTGTPGVPVDVPIGNSTKDVSVRAEVDQRHDDTACRVSMSVTRAVLHD